MPKGESKAQEPLVGSWEEGDDDDDDFMEKVNVYLNSPDGSSNDDKALEGILRKSSSVMSKTVKFADEDDVDDPKSDASKSRQELLTKISRVTELLRQAEELAVIEKDKRRKKEKNLLKLARELKKRNAQEISDKARIEELEEKRRYLEHHWVLAGKELDQEKILRQKLQKEQETDYDRALRDEKEKLTNLRKEYERQVQALKTTHVAQVDELKDEVLKANLEADRLHNQLIGSPRQTRLFSKANFWKDSPLRVVSISMVFAIILFAGYKAHFFSKDAFCAPVMPGSSLSRADGAQTFEAPWWGPNFHKVFLSERFCGGSNFTLQWVPNGQDQKLILSKDNKIVVKKTGVVRAEVYGDRVRTWNRKGLAEDHRSLW